MYQNKRVPVVENDHRSNDLLHQSHRNVLLSCRLYKFGTNQSNNIYSKHHQGTDLLGHHHIIKQGVTDGNMAVICHYSQHVTLCNSKSNENIELSHAFRVGDDVLHCQEVH